MKKRLLKRAFNATAKCGQMKVVKKAEIKEAMQALRIQSHLDYCLFLADVAKKVLFVFEKEYSKDKRPRKAIESIKKYKLGQLSQMQLIDAANEANAAANIAMYDANNAYAVAYAIAYITFAATAKTTTTKTTYINMANAVIAAAYKVAGKTYQECIELLFIKYLKKKKN